MSGLNWERQKELAKLRMDRAVEESPQRGLSRLKFRQEARRGMPKHAQLHIPDCPTCKKPMLVRFRRTDGKRFFGCRNYPDCKTTKELVAGR